MVYEDTTGKGNYAWTGAWYVGNISVFTSGAKDHHLIASWEMVEIVEEERNKSMRFSPWESNNYDTVGMHLENVNINSNYLTFDIIERFENGTESIHITYDIQTETFNGSGIHHSILSRAGLFKKCEYRSVDNIVMPNKEVY